MINLPYQDLHKKAYLALSQRLAPKYQKLVDNYSEMYGDGKWKDIVVRSAQSFDVEEFLGEVPIDDLAKEDEDILAHVKGIPLPIEESLVNRYKAVLQDVDPTLAVKHVRLKFPDKERTMFYLFLTTHDGTGALRLNHVLVDARYHESKLRFRFQVAKKASALPAQPFLFTLEPVIPEPTLPARPTTDEIARIVLTKFGGSTIEKRQLYRELADDIYFPEEIVKALTLLKKKGRAKFSSPLSNNTMIEFSLG